MGKEGEGGDTDRKTAKQEPKIGQLGEMSSWGKDGGKWNPCTGDLRTSVGRGGGKYCRLLARGLKMGKGNLRGVVRQKGCL